jgi:serine/threonine protein phosphatase PrpC
MKYSCKSLTDVGRVRSANEDNLGEEQTPNGHLFVVCDGMGGHVGGATASSIAVNSIIEYFMREKYDNLILAIDRALSFANEQIYASALSNPDLKGMGTTAVVLLIRGEECFIGHVGDSRIYLRSNGKLNRITKDHSFVQTLVDNGVIRDEDAENHPNKNQILQALGIASEVNSTVCQSPILPKAGDMFMLCSDGLNGMVTDRDLENILQEDNLDVSTINLITAANNAGGHDNITASLVLIEESVHATSYFQHFNPKQSFGDMRNTQNFGNSVAPVASTNSKLWYIVGASALAVGIIAAIFLFKDDEEVKPTVENEKKYTLSELEQANDCLNFNEGDSVSVADNLDTTIQINCNGDQYKLHIQHSQITEKTSVVETVKDPEENGQITVSTPQKDINSMTRSEIKSLKKGSEVSNRNGQYERHGYIIKVVDKKVESIEAKQQSPANDGIIKHQVVNGEGMDAIVNKYKGQGCKNISADLIIDHNSKLPFFSGPKNKTKLSNLQQSKLDKTWVLEIPCN